MSESPSLMCECVCEGVNVILIKSTLGQFKEWKEPSINHSNEIPFVSVKCSTIITIYRFALIPCRIFSH